MKNIALAAAAIAAALALPGSANAATATFFSDHCTGGCGPQPNGFATITATETAPNTIGITINPLNGNLIIGSGLTSFTFNLTTDVPITYVGLPSTFDVVNSSTNTQTAGAIHNDGFGTFEYGIDRTVNGAVGGVSSLSFSIVGAGLTLDDFAELSKNGDISAFFALDILSGTTGRTGLVDVSGATPFGVNPTAVPLPPALPLFVAGLAGIGMLKRFSHKRFARKAQHDAALA